MSKFKIIYLDEIVDLTTPVAGSWEPVITKLQQDVIVELIDLLCEDEEQNE